MGSRLCCSLHRRFQFVVIVRGRVDPVGRHIMQCPAKPVHSWFGFQGVKLPRNYPFYT